MGQIPHFMNAKARYYLAQGRRDDLRLTNRPPVLCQQQSAHLVRSSPPTYCSNTRAARRRNLCRSQRHRCAHWYWRWRRVRRYSSHRGIPSQTRSSDSTCARAGCPYRRQRRRDVQQPMKRQQVLCWRRVARQGIPNWTRRRRCTICATRSCSYLQRHGFAHCPMRRRRVMN